MTASRLEVTKQLNADTMTTPNTIATEYRGAQTRRNMFAAFLHWLCVAGGIMFPEVFESPDRLGVINRWAIKRMVRFAIRNMPYLYIAALSGLLGGLGLVWLWWTMRYNYVWLIGRIFL